MVKKSEENAEYSGKNAHLLGIEECKRKNRAFKIKPMSHDGCLDLVCPKRIVHGCMSLHAFLLVSVGKKGQ